MKYDGKDTLFTVLDKATHDLIKCGSTNSISDSILTPDNLLFPSFLCPV